MSAPRVVLVTRRFWPLFGGPEVMMAQLAAGLVRSGVATTVVTAKWQHDWPDEFEHHGARVVRIESPGARWWSVARYVARLRSWLLAWRDSFDVAYVSGLRHEAFATLLASRRAGFPVALRAEQAGLTGDCHWQLEARFGRFIKRRCMRAEAIVAPMPLVEREVIAAGYPRPRIRPIRLGVPQLPPDDGDRRREARRALAASQRRLAVPPSACLAVFAGRLVEGKGLLDLLEAWPAVRARMPEAYLWLVGEGPEQPRLEAEIDRRGLTGQVTLTGAFDDVEDCLRAADVFVAATHGGGGVLAVLEAMSLGLPSVVSDTPAHRQVVDDGKHGRLVPVGQPAALAAAIAELFCDRELAARMGTAARHRATDEFSLERCVRQHVALFKELLGQGIHPAKTDSEL